MLETCEAAQLQAKNQHYCLYRQLMQKMIIIKNISKNSNDVILYDLFLRQTINHLGRHYLSVVTVVDGNIIKGVLGSNERKDNKAMTVINLTYCKGWIASSYSN